jgi:aspartate ammonia-lyase
MTLTPSALSDRLRGTTFLHGLPDGYFWRLSRAVTIESYAAGEVMFGEGEDRRLFAILLEGTVSIERSAEGPSVRLGTLGAGEGVGEGLLLGDAGKHGSTGRALTAIEAAVMTRPLLEELMKENPPIYAALVARAARAISQRLRNADATLVGRGRTMGFAGGAKRIEHDLLGEREVPADALYGVQTLRALENFPITGVPLREFPALVEALAAVKVAAALANQELGLLSHATADAIVRAAGEVRAGRHHEHFLVDMIQGGAGTSTNMNANEVIANRALELLGHERGAYEVVHPNNHVNLSQSTNDVYPTALKLALHRSIDALRAVMRELAEAFPGQGRGVRAAREDGAHAAAGRGADDAGPGVRRLRPHHPGGRRSAGRGAGADPRDQHGRDGDRHEAERAARLSRVGVRPPVGRHGAGADHGPRPGRGDRGHGRLRAAVRCAQALRRQALEDLQRPAAAVLGPARRLRRDQPAAHAARLLDHAGQGEPGDPRGGEPGVLRRHRRRRHGDDGGRGGAAAAQRVRAGDRLPPARQPLDDAQRLRRPARALHRGDHGEPDRMRWFVENSIGIVTALVPVLGYETSTEIAKTALETGRGVYELVLERGTLTREELDRVLNPEAMVG